MTTPPNTYTPRAGSLASQVISFFRNNPDEERRSNRPAA